ncbi:MAG: VacJ family lipoprotein [Hyphomonadaceae bacterium]
MRGFLTALTLAACLAAPVAASAQEAAQTDPADPWEGFNRNLFAVHQGLDGALLEPIARSYRAVTPAPVRGSVLNFLRNLKAPVIFANDVLQGEFNRAGVTAARFGLNTTIGLAGVLDPAEGMGLERHDEDFGQTLAVWGLESGPYLFVPLLGPTTIRDGAGRLIDIALDPLTWADFQNASEVRAGRTVIAGIATREALLDSIDALEESSLDDYVAYRAAFVLSRESAIRNGRTDVQDLPDFSEMNDGPEMETPYSPSAPTSGAIGQQVGSAETSEPALVFSQAPPAPISPPSE